MNLGSCWSRDITLQTKVHIAKAMVFPVVMCRCESWTIKKAEHLRFDDFREDSWESLGLQGDPSSPSLRRSVLNVHWKDWCWSWNSNTLATWCEELTHLKRPWGKEEKGTTEDKMVGWHHQLNGHVFEKAPENGEGQGSLECCSPWGHKDSDTAEQLNNSNKKVHREDITAMW